jgi:hypothetical protein
MKDSQKMTVDERAFYFGKAADFAEIVAGLKALEAEINA